ncbi:MAG: N-6 DNA methylase [Lachnospiraceae bacterium]|nr:N-6 DNA methylase [Lachnospiraceae bacterium]
MDKQRDHMESVYELYGNTMNGKDFLKGALLIHDTGIQLKREGGEKDEQKAYETMLRIAETKRMKNPFESPWIFYKLYKALLQTDEIEWEKLIGSLKDKSMGLVHIQPAVIELFQKHFQSDTNHVLIVEGEKFAPYLKSLVKMFPQCAYVITTQHKIFFSLLEKVFEGDINVRVVLSSVYEYEFLNERFDLILSVPAFGGRNLTENEQQFICREYGMAALENLLLHLHTDGKLVIILPARLTFAYGNVKELREFVQQMYKLEEIAELPAGIFAETGIKTCLFTIKTGQTDDIMIRKYGFGTCESRSEGCPPGGLVLADETFIMKEELEEQGDWNIDKMFAAQDEEWQKYFGMRRVMLGDVAEVFRGRTVSRKDPNGNIAVVNISNLRGHVIDYGGMEHMEEAERKVANYVLREEDLLLPARGTTMRTAIFREQGYTCIASANLIVVRPDQSRLLATYLKLFLDSPVGNKLLISAQQGGAAMNISYGDLKNMEIPLPPMETQKKVSEEYQRELELYQNSIKEAEQRWKTAIARLQNEIQAGGTE